MRWHARTGLCLLAASAHALRLDDEAEGSSSSPASTPIDPQIQESHKLTAELHRAAHVLEADEQRDARSAGGLSQLSALASKKQRDRPQDIAQELKKEAIEDELKIEWKMKKEAGVGLAQINQEGKRKANALVKDVQEEIVRDKRATMKYEAQQHRACDMAKEVLKNASTTIREFEDRQRNASVAESERAMGLLGRELIAKVTGLKEREAMLELKDKQAVKNAKFEAEQVDERQKRREQLQAEQVHLKGAKKISKMESMAAQFIARLHHKATEKARLVDAAADVAAGRLRQKAKNSMKLARLAVKAATAAAVTTNALNSAARESAESIVLKSTQAKELVQAKTEARLTATEKEIKRSKDATAKKADRIVEAAKEQASETEMLASEDVRAAQREADEQVKQVKEEAAHALMAKMRMTGLKENAEDLESAKEVLKAAKRAFRHGYTDSADGFDKAARQHTEKQLGLRETLPQ